MDCFFYYVGYITTLISYITTVLPEYNSFHNRLLILVKRHFSDLKALNHKGLNYIMVKILHLL